MADQPPETAGPTHYEPAMPVMMARPVSLPSRLMYHPPISAWQALAEIILVIVAFVVYFFLLGIVAAFLMNGEMAEQTQNAISIYGEVLVNGIFVLVVMTLVLRIGKTRIGTIGLNRNNISRELIYGGLAVIPAYSLTAVFSILLLLIVQSLSGVSAESIVEEKAPFFEAVDQISVWSIIPVMCLVGLYEEVMFRGFLLGRLVTITKRTWLAVALSSILFGSLHIPTQGLIGFVQTAFLGVLLSYLVVWRKNLWVAIGCHAGINIIGSVLIQLLAPHIEEILQAT